MMPIIATAAVYPHKLRRLFGPFLGLAESCRQIVSTVAGAFKIGEQRCTIPRFSVLGPVATGHKRIRIFSLVHGDEPAGTVALLRQLQSIAVSPALATGYDLAVYPVSNPTVYKDGTRHDRHGLDLNREFWRESSQPETQILEQELRTQAFDGIIALHADDAWDGLYGYTRGRVLNENLLVPALRASSAVLPIDSRRVIDGFPATGGLISERFSGILAPPPKQKTSPF